MITAIIIFRFRSLAGSFTENLSKKLRRGQVTTKTLGLEREAKAVLARGPWPNLGKGSSSLKEKKNPLLIMELFVSPEAAPSFIIILLSGLSYEGNRRSSRAVQASGI